VRSLSRINSHYALIEISLSTNIGHAQKYSTTQNRPLSTSNPATRGQNRPVASQNRLDFGSRYESRQPAETTQWAAVGRGWASEGVRGRIDDPELIRGRTRKSAAWAKDALAWTAGPARIGVLRRDPAKGATPSFKRDRWRSKGASTVGAGVLAFFCP
jgi:hypothetical protein